MPSWSEILNDIDIDRPIDVLNQKRSLFLSDINALTGRNVIAYYSGWLKKADAPGLSISDQDKNAFMSAVYKLDKTKGLDLILHTPGGDLAATESLVVYLKSLFNNDIRAIIPQISMSAGTMIALSCREIIMGKQSSLGPIDPQIGVLRVRLLSMSLREHQERWQSIREVGALANYYREISSTFLTTCDNAVKWSAELAEKWIKEVDPNIDLEKVKNLFLNHNNSYSHSRHISKEECKSVGIKVIDLELDPRLQDAVLSLHHCYMILFDRHPVSKIVESHSGNSYIQNYSSPS
ncbi:serine protease [Porphyromonas gingivalis]|uniref:SDH family Clp fold serine proteinase n=1 Tax=Porphyromonas gingivalis TaxID=837 RepID=UPI000C18DB67|nr:serine protease [Porphyromonas gingivalis]ATS05543.1 serine protease [Porphyromonas gingivalis]